MFLIRYNTLNLEWCWRTIHSYALKIKKSALEEKVPVLRNQTAKRVIVYDKSLVTQGKSKSTNKILHQLRNIKFHNKVLNLQSWENGMRWFFELTIQIQFFFILHLSFVVRFANGAERLLLHLLYVSRVWWSSFGNDSHSN